MLSRQCGLVQILTRPPPNWDPSLESRPWPAVMMVPLALLACGVSFVSIPPSTTTMQPAVGRWCGPRACRSLRERRGKRCCLHAVVGAGLDGKHRLQKALTPESGLFQLV